MIRRKAITAAFAAILAAACGCGSLGNEDHIVIHIANWGGAGDNDKLAMLERNIEREFEKENPGVEIREENIPQDYVSKMILSFVAGAEPDIMMLDLSSAAVFINNGVLQNLTPFIERDKEFKLSDYFPNAANAGRRGNALYAIPQDFTPVVMYYNKRLFDKAGVPYPRPGWNFQQFLDTARKLTIPGDTPDSPPKQAGFVFNNVMSQWVMWLWNNGGEVLSPDGTRAEGTFDSPENVQTVSFLRDLIRKYHVSPSLSAVASLGIDPFANGEAAMTISGHWSMVDYAKAPKGPDGKPRITWDDLGVTELPHNTPQTHTVFYESGYAIGKNCKHKEMAWKFIKYMTSYRVQSQYNTSGIAVDGRKDVAYERAKIPLEAEFMPLIPAARQPWGARVQGYDFVETTGQAAIDSILQNGTPVDLALHRAAQRIDFEFSKG